MSKTRESKRISTSTPKAKCTLLSKPTKKTRAPKSDAKPACQSLRSHRKSRDADTESVTSEHKHLSKKLKADFGGLSKHYC